MNTIIYDIMEKVITKYEKVMDKLIDDIATVLRKNIPQKITLSLISIVSPSFHAPATP